MSLGPSCMGAGTTADPWRQLPGPSAALPTSGDPSVKCSCATLLSTELRLLFYLLLVWDDITPGHKSTLYYLLPGRMATTATQVTGYVLALVETFQFCPESDCCCLKSVAWPVYRALRNGCSHQSAEHPHVPYPSQPFAVLKAPDCIDLTTLTC